jgi:hypothetical protein
MAGYIRQSSFVDGDTITAALFNNEYNQLLNAFNNATGHAHDGTAAEGPVIGLIGDAGETSPNNKVLIDTTNNFIEFYVEVSSAPVQQLYISDGAIIPVTDSDVDLGTSSLYFKDAYIDSITTTGNIDVGGNLTVTGTTTFNGGTITMGDAATDNVVFGADVDSNIIPDDDDTYDLGSSSQEWRNLYIDGTANIDSLVADTADINGGTIDGVTIGGTTAGAVTFTDLSDGTITVTAFVDEDNMASDSATLIPTQQSVKAYVDTTVAATNEVVEDTTPQLGGDLDLNSSDITGTGNINITGTIQSSGNITGTLATAAQPNITSLGTLTGLTTTGDINFGDDDKAIFGAGSDLQIFHNATDSYIVDTGTGNLNIKGSNLYLRANNNDAFIYGIEDGPVRIYHDNVEKFITTATGIDVTGNTESDTVTIGVSSVAGSEKLRVNGTVLTLGGSVSAPAIGIGDTNTGVYAPSAGELGWTVNGTQRLFLDSTGINVTGTVTSDGLTVDGEGRIEETGFPARLVIARTDNANATESASMDLLESTSTGGSFGTTTNYGFRLDIDGGANTFNIKSGSNTIVRKRLSIDRETGDISFYDDTGTSQALFWDASAESLGIGTTSPASTLDIKGDGAEIYLRSADYNVARIIPRGTGANLDKGLLSLFDTGVENVRIDTEGNSWFDGGNVGIGNISPTDKLNISSGTNQIGLDTGDQATYGTLDIGHFTNGAFIGTQAGSNAASNILRFGTSGSERARIDASGNVGIGTTSPFSKLHVGSRGSASVLLWFFRRWNCI